MTLRSTPWRIRRTKPNDLAAVLQLYDEAVAWLNARGIPDQWGTTPISERLHVVAEVCESLDFGAAAELDGLAGFIAVNTAVPTEVASLLGEQVSQAAWVHSLVARMTPEARGAGAALLRWAEAYALGQGRTCLGLGCWAGNTRLVSYYEGVGFRRIGEMGEQERRGAVFVKTLTSTRASGELFSA